MCSKKPEPRRKLKRDAPNGKGSKRRAGDDNAYRDNYDRIFKKDDNANKSK